MLRNIVEFVRWWQTASTTHLSPAGVRFSARLLVKGRPRLRLDRCQLYRLVSKDELLPDFLDLNPEC